MELEWDPEGEGIMGKNGHGFCNQMYLGSMQKVLHKIWLEKTAEGKDSEGKWEEFKAKLIYAQV